MIKADYVPGQVIVRTRGDNSRALASSESFADKYGATVADKFEFGQSSLLDKGEMMQLQLPAGMTTEQAIAKMKNDPAVAYVEPNYIYKLDPKEQQGGGQPEPTPPTGNSAAPNDLVPELWGLHNTGQNNGTAGVDIDALGAWQIHTGRHDAPIIAVIDTGVDYNHPDLAANMWTNTGEIPGNGIDDDGNGVIDDVHGFNAFAQTGDPMDGHGHGTHCAGTIGAVGNNGIGVVGVNHRANIMAVKIFDDSGSTDSAAILRGIEYTTKMGAKITSNSWGGGGASEAQKEAFAASSALHIMAAGNNYSNNDLIANYPSNYDLSNNIAVAASDRNDKKPGFSNYGATQVDIAAPGKDIYSAKPGGGYQSMSGTSMATPHVAGVAALVASAHPEYSAEQIKEAILNGADKLDSWKSKVVDGNRLNAHGALLGHAVNQG
ncbi:MAG: S8 family serine peptidase [Candidatus Eremiobacteraeota bacterium]|nr:S8 family serine peptidase [Candidatus Eremiobacteraeota bacterium]